MQRDLSSLNKNLFLTHYLFLYVALFKKNDINVTFLSRLKVCFFVTFSNTVSCKYVHPPISLFRLIINPVQLVHTFTNDFPFLNESKNYHFFNSIRFKVSCTSDCYLHYPFSKLDTRYFVNNTARSLRRSH